MKKIILFLLCSMTGFILTGCGSAKINVSDSLSVNFEGCDGYGTAKIQDSYEWEKKALAELGLTEPGIDMIDDLSSLETAAVLESAVSYSVTPEKDLSNGDEVIVTININEEKLKDYKLKFIAEERKYIVQGLPEVKEIDLFEDINVKFDGVAPCVRASLDKMFSNKYVETYFSIDNDKNLNIGDAVVVTAAYDSEKLLKAGYKAINDTKEYIVEGVSKYITSLDELPEDADEILKKQTEDIIASNSAKLYGYALDSSKFLGNYLLYAKSNDLWDNYNCVYYIYQVDLSNNKSGEVLSVYYYVGYYDLSLTEDNLCVYDFNNCTKAYHGIYKGWDTIYGYTSYTELYNECVTKNLEKYTFEDTVKIDT